MLDLKLDSDRDIFVTDYDLTLVAGAEEVAQKTGVYLRLFRGEWYIDENDGMPYYQDILTSAPKLSIVEAVFRAAILSREQIESLSSFELTYDNSLRKLDVDFTAVSSEGDVEVSEVFP